MTPLKILLPDRILELLEQRAERSGRSLESEAGMALALFLRREQTETSAASITGLIRQRLERTTPTAEPTTDTAARA